MPKPPQPVGTAKAVAEGSSGPTTWANVYYFGVGTFDAAHLDDVVALVAAAVADIYGTVFGATGFDTTWQVRTTKIAFRDADDSLYKATVADALSGTCSTNTTPSQVAYLLDWFTNDPRKGGKPRQYIPGVCALKLADSAHVLPAYVGEVNSRLATWIAGLTSRSHGTASGLDLLEMSFRDAKAWRTAAHTWPVRGGALNPLLATQRRRIDRLRGD